MSLKKPSVRPVPMPIRKENVQASELRAGDSILGMDGKFVRISSIAPAGAKLQVVTESGGTMTVPRNQLVAVQR